MCYDRTQVAMLILRVVANKCNSCYICLFTIVCSRQGLYSRIISAKKIDSAC